MSIIIIELLPFEFPEKSNDFKGYWVSETNIEKSICKLWVPIEKCLGKLKEELNRTYRKLAVGTENIYKSLKTLLSLVYG